MRPARRFGLSAEQKCGVWRRRKAGQTLHEIGRAFGKDHNFIRGVVARHGGILPAGRRRAHLAPNHLVEALDKLDRYFEQCKGSVKPTFETPAAAPQIIQ